MRRIDAMKRYVMHYEAMLHALSYVDWWFVWANLPGMLRSKLA